MSRYVREIAAIAVPAIVTNITIPLLSLVDMAITGHLGGAEYIGAVAVGGTLFNTLYWLFNFLRMGTTGLTAQNFGAGRDAAPVLWQSLALALTIGVVLIALSEPLCRLALRFMDADDATAALAARYFHILIWGAPAMLGTYSTMGWLIGAQNTRATMVTALATNVTNIALSCIFVFGLHWTIEGVASGTLAAQWFGFGLSLWIIYRKYRPARPQSLAQIVDQRLRRFLSINTDIFLRTACLVAVTLWFTHAGAAMGVDYLAANALLLQLFMLFSFFMDGFAYAAEALVGKYHGAGQPAAVRTLVNKLVLIGLGCAVLFAAIYLMAGSEIMTLLTDRPEVHTLAKRYLPMAVAMPLCGFLAFIYDGVLIGLTRTRLMLAAMATAMTVFFGTLALLPHTNHALWLSFNAYLLTRGIVELAASRKRSAR